MVAAEYEKVLGILDFVRHEKTYGLEGLLAAVDVVAKEEIVRLGWEATVFEKSEEVIILAVNVACGGVTLHTRIDAITTHRRF